jgi:hypothetical protein
VTGLEQLRPGCWRRRVQCRTRQSFEFRLVNAWWPAVCSGFAPHRPRDAVCRATTAAVQRHGTTHPPHAPCYLFQTRAVREIKLGKRLQAAEGRCLLASMAHFRRARIGLVARVNACARRAGMIEASVGLAGLMVNRQRVCK